MIQGYIAASADGYVADAEGGVGWLDRFGSEDFGFASFLDAVDTVVLGRHTFDQVLSFGGDYPYAAKRSVVVTSTPLEADHLPSLSRWTGGIPDLASDLRQSSASTWVVGGAMLQSAFIAGGLLDRLQLFVMPVMLGAGVRLHDHLHAPIPLHLAETKAFPSGAVLLDYRFAR